MSLLPLRPANQTAEVPEIPSTAQLHFYKDETSISPGVVGVIKRDTISSYKHSYFSLSVLQKDAAGEAHHWAQAPVPHGAAEEHQERAGVCDQRLLGQRHTSAQ